ncbi:MAG: hypothetical protein ACI8Y4_002391 [Candidatus Poriferisodalaceae bacterium]|jgi:hypothetical protein
MADLLGRIHSASGTAVRLAEEPVSSDRPLLAGLHAAMVEEITALGAALVSDSKAARDPLVSSETLEELSSLAELDLVAIDDVEVFGYGSAASVALKARPSATPGWVLVATGLAGAVASALAWRRCGGGLLATTAELR